MGTVSVEISVGDVPVAATFRSISAGFAGVLMLFAMYPPDYNSWYSYSGSSRKR